MRMQVEVRYQVKLCRCSITLNNGNGITRIALFLIERIVVFLVFRQENITPFSHGVMYKFCHPFYNLSVVTSHQKYEFFTIVESTKIWKFVSTFSKEIEALDFKHLATCKNGHNLTHGSHWTHETLQTVPAVPTTFVVDLFVILVMHFMWYDICFSDLLVMFKNPSD